MEFWYEMKAGQKLGLVLGGVMIAVMAAILLLLLTRDPYDVLFTNMEDSEAAKIIEALEDMKIAYKLEGGGSTILVPASKLSEVRVKLVSQGLPGSGGIGFELFDNTGYGMTDFAQKINYQRALQGELSRTIMSLPEVRYARVHLVLADSGIFNRSKDRASAAITLLLQPGADISPGQVKGIQSIVASSVRGMAERDVSITDSHGFLLTNGGSSQDIMTDEVLSAKKRLESHLEAKIYSMLMRFLDEDEFSVSVDILPDTSVRRRVTEGPVAESESGVLLKHKQTRRRQDSLSAGKADPADRATNESFEKEYVVSKRIEETSIEGARIERLTVALLVNRQLLPEQIDALRNLVAAAAGIDERRGDVLAVEIMPTNKLNEPAPAEPSVTSANGSSIPQAGTAPADYSKYYWLALLVVMMMLVLSWLGRARKARIPIEERERLLGDIREWMLEGQAKS